MHSVVLVLAGLAVAACAMPEMGKVDGVAPKLWTQPQTHVATLDPIAAGFNSTVPQYNNWVLDVYTTQSQCGTVAQGWSGDFGTCRALLME